MVESKIGAGPGLAEVDQVAAVPKDVVQDVAMAIVRHIHQHAGALPLGAKASDLPSLSKVSICNIHHRRCDEIRSCLYNTAETTICAVLVNFALFKI